MTFHFELIDYCRRKIASLNGDIHGLGNDRLNGFTHRIWNSLMMIRGLRCDELIALKFMSPVQVAARTERFVLLPFHQNRKSMPFQMEGHKPICNLWSQSSFYGFECGISKIPIVSRSHTSFYRRRCCRRATAWLMIQICNSRWCIIASFRWWCETTTQKRVEKNGQLRQSREILRFNAKTNNSNGNWIIVIWCNSFSYM